MCILSEAPPPVGPHPVPVRPDSGSSALRKWSRTQRIRTAAEVPFEVALLDTSPAPTYERFADKAVHLNELGLSNAAIARRMGVTANTVAKAITWRRRVSRADRSRRPC